MIRRHLDQVKKRYAENEDNAEPSSSCEPLSAASSDQSLPANARDRSPYPSRDRRPPDRFAPVVH